MTNEQMMLEGFRELRIWHWNKFLKNNKHAEQSKAMNRLVTFKRSNEKANFHLKFVHLLNELFPFNDTAENDCNKILEQSKLVV